MYYRTCIAVQDRNKLTNISASLFKHTDPLERFIHAEDTTVHAHALVAVPCIRVHVYNVDATVRVRMC